MRYYLIPFIILYTITLHAGQRQTLSLQKPNVQSVKYFDINRITSPVQNNGLFTRHPITGNADFLLDGIQLIYTSGLWIAAKVGSDTLASAADFNTDFVGGAIDAQGNPYGKEDSTFRVYKISLGDNAANNRDYADWPIDLGAPSDGQGNPLLIGDQTLWCSFTDSYLEDRGYNQCLPLGAEVHLTVWGWEWEFLDNVMFLRWIIINKSQKIWQDAYIGIYSDPDLFDANNNLTGSDSTLSLTYCYDGDRNIEIPFTAVGYQVLESPTIVSPSDTAVTFWGQLPGFKNIPVYSPRMEKNLGGSGWNDIPYNEKANRYIYNRLKCLDLKGNPAIDPITNLPTKWAFSGDPITETGWLDNFSPRDRRMMLSTGPVTIVPGDSCAITVAITGVQETIRLQNIIALKKKAMFIKNIFQSQFKILPEASVTVERIDSLHRNVIVKAAITSEIPISTIQAFFYNYKDQLIHAIDLRDDGTHYDDLAGDGIFGNWWRTNKMDDALYLNLTINDSQGVPHFFHRIVDRITLTDTLRIENIKIVADHLNNDGQPNPGENIRVVFGIRNFCSFDINKLSVGVTSPDSLIHFDASSFIMDSLFAFKIKNIKYDPTDETSYLTFDIPPNMPDTHTVYFDVQLYDEKHHQWTTKFMVPIVPLQYVPNEIIPEHIAGRSDASFVIRVIDPAALKGHNYEIIVSDSINEKREKGFNLIDETIGDTILINHPAPDEYAYNVPITDGFKIIKAILPQGGLNRITYQPIEVGAEPGFKAINLGGQYFNGGVFLGKADQLDFYKVELEFVNEIDRNGVNGEPAGQSAFRYDLGNLNSPTGFFSCPFRAWKIDRGERVGRLNACFLEGSYFPTYNNTWAPDASSHGGMETLYIMASEYDQTGGTYLNQRLLKNEVLYEIHLRLASNSSVVHVGGKMVFDWEVPASGRDVFAFIPTQVENKPTPEIPESFILYQNYPNPFNPTTTISFSLTKPSKVVLKIFNIQGQLVKQLFDEYTNAGLHQVVWDGTDQLGQRIASGLFFCQLKTGDKTAARKMIHIK